MSSAIRSIVGLLLLALAVFSPSQTVLQEGSDAKPFVPNNRWALVIGVSGYSSEIGTLKYTAKEAHEFSDTLTRDLAFAPENVRLLADGGEASVAPTSANILGALDALLANKALDKANLFVFYFSGHGVATPRGDYLLPADVAKGEYETKGVPVREVIRRIVGAGLKNVLFITDACRAGTANDFGEELTELCHKANLAVILGCAPGKRSYEYDEFKRGAFTNYLLEALARPELRDASGALWASRLGADVQAHTRAYTLPDKGERNAQTPTLWAEQSTLDVLLAAYPQPPVSDEAVRQFKERAAGLDKKDYAAAMVSYAFALFQKDRTDETVAMLKTVDSLGEMTPGARFVYAVALAELGRKGEAERVFTTLGTMKAGFWRDFGVAMSSARSLSPGARIQAAVGLYESAPSWDVANAACNVIDQWGTFEQRLHYRKLLTTAGVGSPRRTFYARGRLAAVEGRWADAVADYEKALADPGDAPIDEEILTSEFRALASLGDQKALDRFFARGRLSARYAGLSSLVKAQQAKNEDDLPGRVSNLKAALAADLPPDLIFMAAQIAGVTLDTLSDEFKTAAERHPYSWRARMVRYAIAVLKGDEAAAKENMLATDRYLDDPLLFELSIFDFTDEYMREGMELGRIDRAVYGAQVAKFFFLLKAQIEHFGYDPEAWEQFVRYGMYDNRNAQVERLVRSHLPLPPERMPKGLRPTMMTLAMNRGDQDAVRRYHRVGFAPDDRRDTLWKYALYAITVGDAKEAGALTKGLPLSEGILGERDLALRTYLLAAEGRADEAKKGLASAAADPIVGALHGLTYALRGDWTRAEPLLKDQTKRRVWQDLFVQEFAIRTLDARYRATGRLAKAKELAFYGAIEQPGNPLFAHYAFADSPGKDQFVGATTMPCSVRDDMAPNEVKGTLRFRVDPKGRFSGRLSGTGGETIVLEGAIDPYGNVRGTGRYRGKGYVLGAKIAPPAYYKTYPRSAALGQMFQLVDADGLRVALIGWPKGWPEGVAAPSVRKTPPKRG